MNNEDVGLEHLVTKNKHSWFHSLTIRKKNHTSPSQHSLSNYSDQSQNPCNNLNIYNSNDSPHLSTDGTILENVKPRNNEERNFLHRLGKKIGLILNFNSMRRRSSKSGTEEANGTTDASEEFFSQTSPIQAEHQLTFSFTDEMPILPPRPKEFSQDFRQFIAKKWKSDDSDEMKRAMFKACSEMLNQVWYWGEISRRDAQKQLTDKPTGSFLVRDSETSGFTLSFRIYKSTLHYRLEYRDNYWCFEDLQYESIVEMIEDILRRCVNDSFLCFVKAPNVMQPPFPVILKYPLSRYLIMPQLQDLCRRVIQRNMMIDEINELPIPHKLHEYLAEKRELVFAY